MEFRILGPVEARSDGRSLPIGGGKQRAVLAALLVSANEAVSRDRLIDAVWGEAPPPSAHQSLDSYVSRLRRVLGTDRIVRRARGYVLVVEPGELDLERFEALVRTGREAAAEGDFDRAAADLRAALALWRGPAIADVVDAPFALTEAPVLEERRLVAYEERFDVELALGLGAELVGELEVVVREHPLRERLLGQLMLALYRAGRQAEALAALRAAQIRLADELGLEPAPALRELERRILQHDPALAGRRRAVHPRVHGRRPALGGALALVAAAAAVVGVLLGGGENPPARAGPTHANRLLVLSAGAGRVVGAAELPGPPSAVAVGLGSVWVADAAGQTIRRVDPGTGTVVDAIAVGGEPGRLAIGGGAVWVASTLGGEVSRIDPGTDAVTQRIRLAAGNASDIAFGAGGLWVADYTDRALVAIDPASGRVARTLPLELAPAAVAVVGEHIWVAGYDTDTVQEVDSRSGRVLATVGVGHGPSAIAVSQNGVWVANSLDGTVSRIDARRASVRATIAVPSGPSALATTARSVWVASADAGALSQIDLQREMIVRSLRTGDRPSAVTSAGDRVWVGEGSRGELHRGGTLTIVRTGGFASIDPAFSTDSTDAFTRLAYDTLVSFQAAAGPAGLRLVPDLAAAPPDQTDGGRTYAFRIRPGIRYSDGRLLRASDFRRAVARLLRASSPGASYYANVIGAAACTARRRCDLAEGIETNDAAHTVVFRLRAPDPDFLYKLAVIGFSAPIPPGIPDHDVGTAAIPGTGPYRIAAADGRGVRLERNRFFREWSPAAQPAGNPDVILWRSVPSRAAAVQEVASGRADWMFGLPPPALLRALELRDPAQVKVNPTPIVEFIPLNTRRAPFDDLRVRRALNYALDRAKIARWYGGGLIATPLCQPLAPGLPGYRPRCPYTRRPRSDGLWRGPDVARARRLVTASGTRGERIDVWGASDQGGVPREVAPYVARVLRSLGYDVRLHVVPFAAITPRMRTRLQLSVDGDWMPDYPAASAYLPQFFGCHGSDSNGYFCDRALDRRMRIATGLELRDPVRAAAVWAAVDGRLVARAPWAPTVNLHAPEIVSKRLRNYLFSPVGGFIADQVWLR